MLKVLWNTAYLSARIYIFNEPWTEVYVYLKLKLFELEEQKERLKEQLMARAVNGLWQERLMVYGKSG